MTSSSFIKDMLINPSIQIAGGPHTRRSEKKNGFGAACQVRQAKTNHRAAKSCKAEPKAECRWQKENRRSKREALGGCQSCEGSGEASRRLGKADPSAALATAGDPNLTLG